MFERGNLGNLGFPDCQASLRNFSGASKGLRPFSASRALFVHFGAAKMDTQSGRKQSNSNDQLIGPAK
jgi:hypothetical protein